MSRLQDGCWVCGNLREPQHLIVFESRTTIAKLNPDQLFHGYTFVTLKWHEEELHRLSARDRRSFLEDMFLIGAAISKALNPDKMNYELLGNAMPHLHWHVVPRYHSDPMWGRPIWAGYRKRRRLSQDAYADILKKIKAHLPQKRKHTNSASPA